MPDEIEFFDTGPDQGEDEQLPEPARRGLPGSPRTRSIAVIVALVALGAAALIVRATTGSGSDVASVRPTAHGGTAPSSSTITAPGRPIGRLTSPDVIFCGPKTHAPVPAPPDPASKAGMVTCAARNPSTCRTADACTPTGEIPLAVVTAVRVRFPGAAFKVGSTEIVRQNARIWYRYVKLLADHGITIQVLIQQRSVFPGLSGNIDDGTRQIVRAVHRGQRVTTIVQVTQGSGTRPEDRAAAAVARDPRLLAVG